VTRKSLLGVAAVCVVFAGVAPAIDLLDKIDSQRWARRNCSRAEDPAVYPEFSEGNRGGQDVPKNVFGDGVPRRQAGRGNPGDGRHGIVKTAGRPVTRSRSSGRDAAVSAEPEIYICWPDNTFRRRTKDRRSFWWRCVAISRTRRQGGLSPCHAQYTSPLVIAFGSVRTTGSATRTTGSGARRPRERGRVDFAILAAPDVRRLQGRRRVLRTWRKFTREFPSRLIHVQGNSRLPGSLFAPHPNAGYGPFTRYLGPIRWSFDAGGRPYRFRELLAGQRRLHEVAGRGSQVRRRKPIYLFVHSWWKPAREICEKFPQHPSRAGRPLHTTIPSGWRARGVLVLYMYYRLVYIENEYFDFVDSRRMGEPVVLLLAPGWKPGGEHAGVKDRTVKGGRSPCLHPDAITTIGVRRRGRCASANGVTPCHERSREDASFHTTKRRRRSHGPGARPIASRSGRGPDGVLHFRINITRTASIAR